MSAKTVSIVVPAYCEEAVIETTYRELAALMSSLERYRFELIVVDDGSTDETPRVLDSLLRDIPQPVRCFRQPNRGCDAARNTGLDLARGK